jgi:hypothetical protein
VSNVIRAVVLAFLVCTGQAARGADEVRASFTSQARFADADRIEVRMVGGNAVLARLGVGPGLVRTLGAAWLSSSREFMSVAGSRNGDGSFEAVCADSRAVESRLGLLGAQLVEFGAPVLLVEAERPENAGDQRAAAQLQQGLAELGIVAVDAEAARARRRSLADAAVKDGMDAEAGRAAIDRPDVDFVLRVRWSKRDERDGASYGISLSSCEITIASTLLRIGNQSSVPVSPGIGSARSRSPRAADIEAERIAVEDAVLSVAAAASAEWMGLAAGERPWIIEVQAPNGVDLAAIAGTSSGGEVVVLEDRPGIGALMRVPGDVARQIGSGPSAGKVLHRRPGFLLIAGGGFEHGNLAPWWWGGSALLAVVVVLGAIAWRMKRESARQIAPREPRD